MNNLFSPALFEPMRRNHWYFGAFSSDGKIYRNGKLYTWWRRLLSWAWITLLIIVGKERL